MEKRDEILLHRIVNKMFLTINKEELINLNKELKNLFGDDPPQEVRSYIIKTRVGEIYRKLMGKSIFEPIT